MDIRKRELDRQLVMEELEPRLAQERIATPVPTWSIETWLLALLGDTGLREDEPLKVELLGRHGERVDEAIVAAVHAWREGAATDAELLSLRDGVSELARLSG